MTSENFTQFDELQKAEGADAMLDTLIKTLRDQKEYHPLFEALLMKKKHQLGLPIVRPTSFDDVPPDRHDEFERSYVQCARETGQGLLDEGKLSEAWIYFRTIREPEAVAAAIDQITPRTEADEETEEIIKIALYEGANPVQGLAFMLESQGTCSTITALSQQLPNLDPEDRKRAAAMMVKKIYGDLCQSINQEVQNRLGTAASSHSLRELMTDRDWLFAEGNYHTDVSHLNSVVQFARSLDSSRSELELAIELAEYGSKLDEKLQYPGDPPFEEFYPAHLHYLNALAGKDQDRAIVYFRGKLEPEQDDSKKQLIAYVIVELMGHIGKMDQALDLAERFLKDVDESSGFSFTQLCVQADRMDTLQRVSKEQGNLVRYAAALIQGQA